VANIPENLTLEIEQLASELKRVEQRLKSEAAPDRLALNEFRHAVDNVRLTAWSVSELINAEHTKKNPETVLAFLAAERLRRFDQMVRNLCGDIERRIVTFQTNGMHSLIDSVNMLQQRFDAAIQ
jgi:Mg2+ and Co2+ transporter CorA